MYLVLSQFTLGDLSTSEVLRVPVTGPWFSCYFTSSEFSVVPQRVAPVGGCEFEMIRVPAFVTPRSACPRTRLALCGRPLGVGKRVEVTVVSQRPGTLQSPEK